MKRIPEYSVDKARCLNSYYANNSGTGEGSLEQRLFSDNKAKQQVDLIAEFVFKAEPSAEPEQVGSLPRPNGELSTSQAMRIYDAEHKAVTLKGCGGGAGGKTGLYATNDKPIFEVKDGLITIKGKQYPIKLEDGFYNIRKLTVEECMRLQTVPEWYEFPVSNSQAYKMLGNGWTCDVITHLINACLSEQLAHEQLKLF